LIAFVRFSIKVKKGGQMKKQLILGIGLLVLSPGAIYAENQIPEAVKAKMNGYVGVWEFSEKVMETPDSEAVEVSGEWSAKWIFDHLIEWRGNFMSAGYKFTTVEYEGYDKQNKGYTHWFTSAGYRGNLYDGVWDGNTISFQEKSFAPDGTATRARCHFSYNEDFTQIDYACKELTDGVWWTARQGSAKKK
jgi:hypothetical protein